jgi:hypothetical protein
MWSRCSVISRVARLASPVGDRLHDARVLVFAAGAARCWRGWPRWPGRCAPSGPASTSASGALPASAGQHAVEVARQSHHRPAGRRLRGPCARRCTTRSSALQTCGVRPARRQQLAPARVRPAAAPGRSGPWPRGSALADHGAAAGLALDQAFVLQPLQHRAHLRPADLEQLGQALFPQTRAGRKAVLDHRRNDARVNYFRAVTAARKPACRFRSATAFAMFWTPRGTVLVYKMHQSCVQDAPCRRP